MAYVLLFLVAKIDGIPVLFVINYVNLFSLPESDHIIKEY